MYITKLVLPKSFSLGSAWLYAAATTYYMYIGITIYVSHVPLQVSLHIHEEGPRMYILWYMRRGCYGCRKADSPAEPSVYSYLSN